MILNQSVTTRIKEVVANAEPNAKIILFGSVARGEAHDESDIDLLILVKQDSVSRNLAKTIRYNLYDIEFDSGQIISPIIFTEREWNEIHSITPLYKNISKEGIIL